MTTPSNEPTPDTAGTIPAIAMAAAAEAGGLDDELQRDEVHRQLFPSAPAEPTRIGRFVLLRRVGAGGMGAVYAGYDEQLDRRVAIKVLHHEASHSPRAHKRLVREAQALARLSHPNVVQIHEVGEVDEMVFIVMEFVEGVTLRDWLGDDSTPADESVEPLTDNEAPEAETGRRPPARSREEILSVFAQAGEGLAAAHALGLIHRDFKPSNVMVGSDGRVRVLDFGIARLGNDAQPEPEPASEELVPSSSGLGEQLTRTGALMGTPRYMAPEQFKAKPLDARTDQFSFCVALCEALFGRHPFEGSSLAALMISASTGELQAPLPGRDVPGWLRAVVQRGLKPDPAERFESMDALLQALGRDPAVAWRRRLRLLALVLVVGSLAAGLVFGGQWLRQRWQEQERQVAALEQLGQVEAQIERLRASGDQERAQRIFQTFVERPDLQGTEALGRAWLGEARRLQDDEQPQQARSAYARAYLLAQRDEIEAAALVGLATEFRRQLDFGALERVLGTIAERHPARLAEAELVEMRLERALLARDLRQAHALLSASDHQDTRLPLLAAIQPATMTKFGAVRHVWPFDLEGDGTPELLLHEAGSGRLTVVSRDPALTPIVDFTVGEGRGHPVPPAHGEPGRFLMADGDDVILLRLHPDGTSTEELRWKDSAPLGVTAGDLDGDGEFEIFTALGPYSRRIVRLARDTSGRWSWSTPVSAADASQSDLMEVLVADLGGDGRLELVAATSHWVAYDVRVFRPQGDGLRLLARDRIGPAYAQSIIHDAAGEAMIVTSKTGGDGNAQALGPEHPNGDPPGLYVHRLVGDQLERVAHVPVPTNDPDVRVLGLETGDIDGDGIEDIGLHFGRKDGDHTLFALQSADGRFTPVLLGHGTVHQIVQLDDDPPAEILFELEREDDHEQLWVLGHGTGELPVHPLSPPSPPAAAPPVEPALARAWERAARLESLGLFAEAARAFEDIAATTGQASPTTQLRAAQLHERASEEPRALELFDALREHPEHGLEATRGSLRIHTRAGEYARALSLTKALLGVPQVEEPERASLLALRQQLDAIIHGSATLDLRFDQPLPEAAQIHQPGSLRRDPIIHSLEVSGTGNGPLLSLPVTWSGGYLHIELDSTQSRAEWSSGLYLELVPESEGESLFWLQRKLEGGGSKLIAESWCHAGDAVDATERPHHVPGSSRRNTLRLSYLPALQERRCSVIGARGGRVHDALSHMSFEAPPPGRYRLVLHAYERNTTHSWYRAVIHRITATGLALAEPRAQDDPWVAAGRAQVEGDYRHLLDALEPLADTGPRAQAMRAHAQLMLGRVDEARQGLDGLLGSAEDAAGRAVDELLRRDPSLYGPLLRDHADFARVVLRAWSVARSMHMNEPAVQQELLAMLGPLPLASMDGLDIGTRVMALSARAEVHAKVGQTMAAVRDLDDALALTEQLPESVRDQARRGLEVEFAALEVERGRLQQARARIDRVLEKDPRRMYLEDLLRADPRLSRVFAASGAPSRAGPPPP